MFDLDKLAEEVEGMLDIENPQSLMRELLAVQGAIQRRHNEWATVKAEMIAARAIGDRNRQKELWEAANRIAQAATALKERQQELEQALSHLLPASAGSLALNPLT